MVGLPRLTLGTASRKGELEGRVVNVRVEIGVRVLLGAYWIIGIEVFDSVGKTEFLGILAGRSVDSPASAVLGLISRVFAVCPSIG